MQPANPLPRLLGGAVVALALSAYYWLYFLPPRLLGAADPDRYYHLGLSRLIAQHGLLKQLPQAEDLGWGRYFPDKEFLFHALTGGASAIGGDTAVLWLVPLTGVLVALLLYAELSRRLPAWQAAALVALGTLGTVGFMFRITLLRPHLLAIACFVLLLLAVLRARPRLAALAAMAFALSYHAFYLPMIVAGVAFLLRRQPGMPARTWLWCVGGIAAGLVLNPYFPSNLGMAAVHLKLALGLEALPAIEQSPEVLRPTAGLLLSAYGFVYATLLLVATGLWRQRFAQGEGRTAVLLLFLVTGVLALLSLKSVRAMEYGVPCAILLAGVATQLLAWRPAMPLLLASLLVCQGLLDVRYYVASWTPVQSGYPAYAALLRQIPEQPGLKVFNCEWETGAFVLHARPDLHFVDLLEPAFLWHASPTRYQARLGLLEGGFADPRSILRGAFHADYVLCGERNARFIQQMQSLPQDFRAAPGTEGDPVRLFAVRPD